MAPFSQFFISELNVRLIPHTDEELRELADSIKAVGILQNLVAIELPDGRLEVVAGGGRTKATGLLVADGVVDTETFMVPYKPIPRELGVVASATENGKRKNMHPYEQLIVFRQMSESGKTLAEISALLGYSTRHVQKCLRVAGMATALVDALKEDQITLDQLQALSATEDHQRQLNIWTNASNLYLRQPQQLRGAALQGEVSAENNPMLEFIGRDVYEKNGGAFRFDLFTDQGFITEPALLERLAQEKLHDIAKHISAEEGWAWGEGRLNTVKTWGEDAQLYRVLRTPSPVYTDEEVQRMEVLQTTLAELESECDALHEDADLTSLTDQSNLCEYELDELCQTATHRTWSQDMKAQAGVVVALVAGDAHIQRGIVLRTEETDHETSAGADNTRDENSEQDDAKSAKKGLSAALVKSLSSERTLAVQAALASEPEIALVVMLHSLVVQTFYTGRVEKPLHVSLTKTRDGLLNNAPTATDDLAMMQLDKAHRDWEAKLPEDWQHSYDWLMTWPLAEQLSMLAYCIAGAIDGVTEQVNIEGKVGSKLEGVEALLPFNIRDWWQPKKANFFGRVSKNTITDSLMDAGCSRAAVDVDKMKKGAAAELAENVIGKTRWVPACLLNDKTAAAQLAAETDGTIHPIAA
ncbi:ParB/RepB/Spo0J family partition protein [Photorhabdus sp. RM71S]|uniref:ParB/RepB/Spo0J family partition protein n=1 Tax=Photorhabdus sp. RM71S TaxID=3342824 RepID=UPI0036DB7749